MTDLIILPPNSKAIPLTQGKFAIVDESDYEWLNQWKWCVCRNGYAKRNKYYKISKGAYKSKTIRMHRLIMSVEGSLQVDHIDGNKLNNLRNNLRICTLAQNNRNCGSRVKGKKYKGVSWSKSAKKWHARIRSENINYHLGFFENEIDAVMAYNKAAKNLHGAFAWINNV